jgi:hypothetical protein
LALNVLPTFFEGGINFSLAVLKERPPVTIKSVDREIKWIFRQIYARGHDSDVDRLVFPNNNPNSPLLNEGGEKRFGVAGEHINRLVKIVVKKKNIHISFVIFACSFPKLLADKISNEPAINEEPVVFNPLKKLEHIVGKNFRRQVHWLPPTKILKPPNNKLGEALKITIGGKGKYGAGENQRKLPDRKDTFGRAGVMGELARSSGEVPNGAAEKRYAASVYRLPATRSF